jgi:hypothetical protein
LLYLYLSGGVVFSGRTLNDYFDCGDFSGLKRHIYAVVFEAISNQVLEGQHTELSSTRPASSTLRSF